jgi:hypothetical protein
MLSLSPDPDETEPKRPIAVRALRAFAASGCRRFNADMFFALDRSTDRGL